MQNNPGASQNNQAASDSTTIFRMPSTDATVPDLMGAQRLANPTLSIVKGPHTGTTFVLVTLAIDLLYIAVNPKIRLQGGEA